MWTSIKGIFGLIHLLRRALEWWIAEKNKQIGRDEVKYDVTRKTAEAENRMRNVPKPSDSDIAKRLQDGTF